MNPHLVHVVELESIAAPDDGGVDVHNADVPDDDLLRPDDLEALAADHTLPVDAHDGFEGAHAKRLLTGHVVGDLKPRANNVEFRCKNLWISHEFTANFG